MNIFKWTHFLAQGNKSLFDISRERQEYYLNSLKIPQDDIDRSYCQYKCQNIFLPRWKRMFFNIGAAIITPLLIIIYTVKSYWTCTYRYSVDAIGEFKGMEEVVPDIITQEFNINNDVWCISHGLRFSDFPFIIKILLRYPFAPYFVFKIVFKIGGYSSMIHRYTPKAILVHNEYSFTSSVLTAYCQKQKVEHINIMHGEKLFFIRDSFFHYDRCYVWNEHYVRLFHLLKAEFSQFRIASPRSIAVESTNFDSNAYAEYKYYLAGYGESVLKSIIASLTFIANGSKRLKYRPHPRYSDISLLEKLVPRNEIEYPDKVDILKSVASCSYAIGSCSTVLFQAYNSGKRIILDDKTFKEEYDKLKSLDYHLAFAQGVNLLSEFQTKKYEKISDYHSSNI